MDSPGGSREPFGQPGRLQGTIWTIGEAAEPVWTAREAPGNHLGPFGQLQGLKEARDSRNQFGSPGGSRERFGQPGRLERAAWTAREAPEGWKGNPLLRV